MIQRSDYCAPFSPCDLVTISIIKAMSVIQVRTSKSSFTPPLPYLSHSIHSHRPYPHFYPYCHCPRSTSIVSCLNFYVGLFIVLPASTFFPHDFILGVWPDGTLTEMTSNPSTKISIDPSFPKEKHLRFRWFLRLQPQFMCIYPALHMPCRLSFQCHI